MAARWRALALAIVVSVCSACSLVSIVSPCPQGEICFGTDIDLQTFQLSGRTNTFEVGQPIASVAVVGSFGDTKILVRTQVSRVEADGTETVEYEETGRPSPPPKDNAVGGKGDLSMFLSGPGNYVERLTVAPYVQNGPPASPFMTAEGRFQLVASSSVPS